MFGLSDGAEIMTLAFFVLIQYRSVTDGQTDGQTDGRTDGHLCSGYTSSCIACYANALEKLGELWSTNKNVFVVHIDPPKRTFFADYISAIGGAAPDIFIRVTD